jgi:EAL domain-containing protein (putative c-di-GMP-specific phosphodiesterase class I)
MQLDLEQELSRVLREEEVRVGAGLPAELMLFLNTHPVEVRGSGLAESLQAIRKSEPCQPLVLELHEAAVGGRQAMLELKAALTELDIGLAYDDFGAGQSRLLELTEVPPDYLKFDITLLRGIHLDTGHRMRMVGQLVHMVREMGIVPLAEGIECREEGEACAELGFELAQGFYYGKPMPLERARSKS